MAPTAGSTEKICVWQSRWFWGLSPQEPLCLIQGEQVHRDTKRLKKGGKVRVDSFFFHPFYSTLLSFFDFKGTLWYLNAHHDSRSGNLKKDLAFFVMHSLLCGSWWGEKKMMQQSWILCWNKNWQDAITLGIHTLWYRVLKCPYSVGSIHFGWTGSIDGYLYFNLVVLVDMDHLYIKFIQSAPLFLPSCYLVTQKINYCVLLWKKNLH